MAQFDNLNPAYNVTVAACDANHSILAPSRSSSSTTQATNSRSETSFATVKPSTPNFVILGGDQFTYPATITYDGKVQIEDSADGTFTCSNVSASFNNTSENGTGSVNGSGTTSS